VAGHCQAKQAGTVAQLPLKLGRKEPVELQGALLVVRLRSRVLLRQRDKDDRRMAGFWDLPAGEDLPQARIESTAGKFRHTITHHHYTFTVLLASTARPMPRRTEFRWFSAARLGEIPLSTTARKGLRLAGVLPSAALPSAVA
jgi:adenine-specific DNA glycosylase